MFLSKYTFHIDDKGVNVVVFYDQTRPGVEFSMSNTRALIGKNFAKKKLRSRERHCAESEVPLLSFKTFCAYGS